jgi:hypothetical protein
MKFFLPPANDAETAERSYQAIKKPNTHTAPIWFAPMIGVLRRVSQF